jgi:hypothetical protein
MSDSEKQASDSEKPVTEPMSDSEKGIEEVKKQMEEEKPDEEPVEKVKAKRKTMTTEEKQTKKKEANKEYYIRTRQKMGDVETQATAPKATPKATPKAKVAKVQEYEPSSPRTRMTEAYRELRIQEQERRSQRYASWFQ